ncbi:MAG: TlpA disulfide reductase family protein [Cellulophaga sp.]|uniref:TlpA disulfide reductase family protein n=1 Tax=unclassified Cellulophaga TaxID=2634405 RepID=UPI0026E3CA39|nr:MULTISPECIES: TlpA disulfide reductase family protein [unclassified Cellulophaga]MDO6492227.1 TlpA disulfide reductase family protein [Cellulophaga sp. 2_MG-2023]MDO6493177.1 TlpA disulfide reductase family protein [Cellulophaga sp. 3_MG-2023]
MRSILKVLVVFISVTTAFYSCKEKQKEQPKFEGYTINGIIKGANNTYAKLLSSSSLNFNEAVVLDSTIIKDGKFQFSGKVEFPDQVTLMVDKYVSSFFIENSDITVSGDVSNITGRDIRFTLDVKGSKSNDEYEKIKKSQESLFNNEKYKPLEKIRELYAKAKETKSKEDLNKAMALQEELRPLMLQRNDERVALKYNYVRENPSSTLAPYVLGVQYTEGRMTRDELKEFYNIFKGDARKTAFFKGFITKIYKDNFENIGVGNTAPDFTLNTNKGEELTLSKVEGKYILVDFWASWCVPCRASFPHLKELRKQYKEKGFTIVGVGTADEKEKWEKAIIEDQTPWSHVYDPSENHAYGAVAKSYGVPHLPTTLLIDSNRKIILRNPTKEELDNKLKELMKIIIKKT